MAKAKQAAWVRLVREPLTPLEQARLPRKVTSPDDVVQFMSERVEQALVEIFWVLYLNTRSRIVGCEEVTRGLLNSSLVHPREVFRGAIAAGAAAIIVAHNHPSGDPEPSAEDKLVTRQLVAAGKLLDIPVYDHLILCPNGQHISLLALGVL